MSRFDVRSADGTRLAVWVDGDGPPLVLVHGSLCDHSASDPMVAALRDDMTTFAMDRRGFGCSGDTAPYAIEREFEDVAAVVDAVAARTGSRVSLWGHSYGAGCAVGAATLTTALHRLVLYEPGLGVPYPPGSIAAIEAAVAAGDMDSAVAAVLRDVVGLGDDEIAELRASERWSALTATGSTVPRECRVEDRWTYRPGQFDGLRTPTLFLTGSQSPRELREATERVAAAIAGARTVVLEGCDHLAPQNAAGIVAARVLAFVDASPPGRPR